MQIAIVGTGYVGLVSGVCLAAKGHAVTCVDINPNIVKQLNDGQPHIYERGLPELLASVRAQGLFKVTASLNEALDACDLVMVAVGTPSENGVIDLRYVTEVARQIGDYIKQPRAASLCRRQEHRGARHDGHRRARRHRGGVGQEIPGLRPRHEPRIPREGEAIADFMGPDRVVMGFEDPATRERLETLYAPWSVEKLFVNTRTAELIKYANNALLATQISAINEIANLAASLGGIDVMDVVQGVHLDKRWSPVLADGGRVSPQILTYLVPGCGFGGSCFPKDVQAIRSLGQHHGLPMPMMNAVLDINESQPDEVLRIIERDLPDVRGKNVLVLGLAFKPETDDVRESASLKIVGGFVSRGANVTAHDPIASENFKKAMGPAGAKVRFVDDWKHEVEAADVVIVATKWRHYETLPDADLSGKIVFDARRMFAPGAIAGGLYRSIGRRLTQPAGAA